MVHSQILQVRRIIFAQFLFPVFLRLKIYLQINKFYLIAMNKESMIFVMKKLWKLLKLFLFPWFF